MDTLDKIVPQAPQPAKTETPVKGARSPYDQRANEALNRDTAIDGAEDGVEYDNLQDEEPAEDVGGEIGKPKFRLSVWQIAGIAGGVTLVAAGGIAYWRMQYNKPKSRFERFRSRLGLDNVNLDKVRSQLNDRFDDIDFDKLNAARRDAQHKAQKTLQKTAREYAHRYGPKYVRPTIKKAYDYFS